MTARRLQIVVASVAADDEERILTRSLQVAGLAATRKLLARFNRARRSLVKLADRGRVVPELDARGISVFRELQIAPYRMIYRVTAEDVRIVALVDGRRDLTDLLLERAGR